MHIIHIEPLAPAKPALGATCNGCGVCCLYQPCPLGMVLFRRRTGACPALLWVGQAGQYRCGALVQPDAVARKVLPAALGVLARPLALVLRCAGPRWIASARGCDSTMEAVPSSPTGTHQAACDTQTEIHD